MKNATLRQLKVFEQTADLKRVVDYMVEETRAGVEHTVSNATRVAL